jgi:cyclic pyranopterin phosphate synthase
VTKLRLTGGEPLLRPGMPALVRRLAAIDGVRDLALTTNGILLPRQAQALKQAGLSRITVSLDALDPQRFLAMSGGRGSVEEVLAGIAAAEDAGFRRLKINTVVQRGVNEACVLDIAEHFRGSGHTVRFIEFMDVGNLNHWSREQVVPSAELLKLIHDRWPLRPVAQQASSDTARRYAYEDGQGEVGFISSITEPFCGDCTRARLAADGTLYTCLFASRGLALRPLLRQGAGDERLAECITGSWRSREDRYSERRAGLPQAEPHVEMYRIGG